MSGQGDTGESRRRRREGVGGMVMEV